MKMYKFIIFAHCLCQFANSFTTYDQRQDGPWNLEIDVKNVQIVAITKGNKEEYVDYDYAYDYSEMTIKPPNGTKPKPINSTILSMDTPSVNETNTTESFTDVKKNNTDDIATTLSPIINNSTSAYDTANASPTTNDTAVVTTQIANCKKGFVLKSNGHCELELQGTTNALQKLVKLSQKLKWRRANRHKHEGTA